MTPSHIVTALSTFVDNGVTTYRVDCQGARRVKTSRLQTRVGYLGRRRLAHSLRPIASGQHPSAVAKHDQPTRILLDAGSVDRSGGLEVGVPIKDLLDAGPFT